MKPNTDAASEFFDEHENEPSIYHVMAAFAAEQTAELRAEVEKLESINDSLDAQLAQAEDACHDRDTELATLRQELAEAEKYINFGRGEGK